jgi:hypothetical protein
MEPASQRGYMLIPASVTWQVAVELARTYAFGKILGQLALISTAAENDVVQSLFSSYDSSMFGWLGGARDELGVNNGIFWHSYPSYGVKLFSGPVYTNGSVNPDMYANFLDNQPDFVTGGLAITSAGKWYVRLWLKNFFVLYFSKNKACSKDNALKSKHVGFHRHVSGEPQLYKLCISTVGSMWAVFILHVLKTFCDLPNKYALGSAHSEWDQVFEHFRTKFLIHSRSSAPVFTGESCFYAVCFVPDPSCKIPIASFGRHQLQEQQNYFTGARRTGHFGAKYYHC